MILGVINSPQCRTTQRSAFACRDRFSKFLAKQYGITLCPPYIRSNQLRGSLRSVFRLGYFASMKCHESSEIPVVKANAAIAVPRREHTRWAGDLLELIAEECQIGHF
jgi:hypothetical protein